MDKSKEKYAGFASLRDLKNAYLLLARDEERKAAEEELSAKKAGAGAEKSAQSEPAAMQEKGEKAMQEDLEGEVTVPEEGQTGESGEVPEEVQEEEKEEQANKAGEIISRRVRKFLLDYPAARFLKREILAELRADPAIEGTPYCLEIALGRAAGKAYVPKEELMADENFVRDYVLTNQDVKGRIIEEYLSAIAGGMPPAVMAASGRMTALPPEKPTSVSAAGRILERMLKERRI